jgi:hypothetical protein
VAKDAGYLGAPHHLRAKRFSLNILLRIWTTLADSNTSVALHKALHNSP